MGALTAVTAAVVGVILNLAVWFGWQVLVPARGVVDWFALVLGVVAFAAMQRFKIGVVPVVLASDVIGLAWHWVN